MAGKDPIAIRMINLLLTFLIVREMVRFLMSGQGAALLASFNTPAGYFLKALILICLLGLVVLIFRVNRMLLLFLWGLIHKKNQDD